MQGKGSMRGRCRPPTHGLQRHTGSHTARFPWAASAHMQCAPLCIPGAHAVKRSRCHMPVDRTPCASTCITWNSARQLSPAIPRFAAEVHELRHML